MIIVGIVVLLGLVAFIAGRKYERKQFVKIGKPKKSIQEVLGVFNDNGRKN